MEVQGLDMYDINDVGIPPDLSDRYINTINVSGKNYKLVSLDNLKYYNHCLHDELQNELNALDKRVTALENNPPSDKKKFKIVMGE